MPEVALNDLPALVHARQRLLGLDLGSKTIGLAISDSGLSLASPLKTINRTKFMKDARHLIGLCQENRVGGLILGLPVNMDGTEGKRCQITRQFARSLKEELDFDLPYAFWDERLSTSAVERFLIEEADMSRQRRSEVVDKMAAGFILQGALDYLSAQKFKSREGTYQQT